MGWFGGGKKDEAWQRLCRELGAEFVEGGMWKGNQVRLRHGPWTIVLDTYTVHTQHSHITYTRMRAPFVNHSGFRFSIHRKGFFSGLGKMIGMQDIEVGDPTFDEAFILRGNEPGSVQNLLSDPTLRAAITAQPQIRLEVKDSEGWFGPSFPADTDELLYQVVGVVDDVGRLKALFDLFASVLDRLCRLGLAYESEPGVTL